MSLMAQVERARSTLQSANEQLSEARGILNSNLGREIGDGFSGFFRRLGDEISDTWDSITNPIETAKDAWAGLQEAVDDPEQALKEAWNGLKAPFEEFKEDWNEGHEGEAIGRGLAEVVLLASPTKIFKGLKGLGALGGDNDDNSDSDDGSDADDGNSDKDDEPAEDDTKIRPGSDEDLLKGATKTEGGSKKVDNYEKPGGFDQANKEFDQYTEGREVKDQGGGIRSATLPDGRTVSVRPDSSPSSGGHPTIHISPPRGTKGGITTKIRYTD